MRKLKYLAILLSALMSLSVLASCKEEENVHTHAFGDWSVTADATCTEVGAQVRSCACGAVENAEIPALGHTYGEWVETKAATYSEEGEEERVCANNEEHKETRPKAAIAALVSWDVSASASDSVLAKLYSDTRNSGMYVLVVSGSGNMRNWTDVKDVPWYTQYAASISTVTIESGVKTVGQSAFYGCTALSSLTLGDSVASIEASAFEGCKNLYTFTVPDGIEKIGYRALEGCPVLFNVYKNKLNYLGNDKNPYLVLFSINNKQHSTVEIHKNTKVIYDSAFSGCTYMSEIVIPDGVLGIGAKAFEGCTNLTKITLPDSLVYIGTSPFELSNMFACTEYGNAYYIGSKSNPYLLLFENKNEYITSVNIHEDTKFIHDNAFYSCARLSEVIIPESVIYIGASAFSRCTNLDRVSIFGNITEIPDNAFYNCTDLESINIPNTVKSIGKNAFYNATYLESIDIPASVAYIDSYAFFGCGRLANINVSADNQTYKSVDGNVYTKDGKCLVRYAPGKKSTSFEVPDGVTTICDYAFQGCVKIETVTVPNTVTWVGWDIFNGCTNVKYRMTGYAYYIGNDENPYLILVMHNTNQVTSMRIEPGTKVIACGAFNSAELDEVYVPISVEYVGDKAFGIRITLINCAAESKPDGWSDSWFVSTNTSIKFGY